MVQDECSVGYLSSFLLRLSNQCLNAITIQLLIIVCTRMVQRTDDSIISHIQIPMFFGYNMGICV